jgi:preprotein translocase subunit Sss1
VGRHGSAFHPHFPGPNDRLPAMEPIRHSLTARLGLLKMYREEVDQLMAMFRESCEKVIISDSKYRYQTLDEMKENVPSPIKYFDIRGENPAVRFLFNQTEVVRGPDRSVQSIFNELRTDEITDAADTLFYKVKEFLVTYQRPNSRKGFIAAAVVSLMGLFWFALHNSRVDNQGQQTIGSPPGFFICLAAFSFFLAVGLNVKNYLSLETKRNSASFFTRNREEFAKQAVTAGISTVIGGVIGYCIALFMK